jgi:hypothetical protein
LVADTIVKAGILLFQLIFGTLGIYTIYINAIVLAVCIFSMVYMISDISKFIFRRIGINVS